MPILEILKKELPKRRVAARIEKQLGVIRPYFDEIKEAQDKGYSWSQICKAVEKELSQKGEWLNGWSTWDVQRVFYIIKKEAA